MLCCVKCWRIAFFGVSVVCDLKKLYLRLEDVAGIVVTTEEAGQDRSGDAFGTAMVFAFDRVFCAEAAHVWDVFSCAPMA